jgi:hypothetical protein
MISGNAKKHAQLGMNHGTAQNRLVKDILFSLVIECDKNKCHHCGKPMERQDFSIEHKTPWLDSENPLKLFFDLENISFSHLSCNIGAARKTNKKYYTPEEVRKGAQEAQNKRRKLVPPEIRKVKRREQYLRTGK